MLSGRPILGVYGASTQPTILLRRAREMGGSGMGEADDTPPGPMTEADFWLALEYRVCDEFAGFEDMQLRFYSCDGRVPDEYDLQANKPCIRGLAYIGHRGQERWHFTLLLGAPAKSQHDVGWSSLLPPAHVTGWLSPHPDQRTLIMDPVAAHVE